VNKPEAAVRYDLPPETDLTEYMKKEGKDGMRVKRKDGDKVRMNSPVMIRLICTLFYFAIFPAPAQALTAAQVFNKVKNSVVVVETLDFHDEVKVQGSGVILPSGKVATNCHVVEGGVSFRVGRGNRLVPATLHAEDSDKDICILSARDLKGKSVQLGKTTGLKVGDPVYAVGTPKGLELSLSNGIVSQLRSGPSPLIQTTAAISPGSSGGGLFDGAGRLVGLTTLYIEGGQNLNFAMPVEEIAEIKPGCKKVAKGHRQVEGNKSADALYNLGINFAKLNQDDDAVEAYRQALRLDPKFAEAWYNLGITYRKLNRQDEAIEAYRQTLRLDPEWIDAWYNLGMTYADLNRQDDAIEAYRQALRLNPNLADAWNNLGIAYGKIDRYEEAIDTLHQALRLDPESADAWHNLGYAYVLSGNRTAALDAFRQLQRLDPGEAAQLFNLIVAGLM